MDPVLSPDSSMQNNHIVVDTNRCGIRSETEDNHTYSDERHRSSSEYAPIMDPGDKYVPIREATMLTSITPQLLRKYADDGTVKSYKTPAGHRRFSYDDLQRVKSKSYRKGKAKTIVREVVRNARNVENVQIRVGKRARARNHYIYARAATEDAMQEQVQFAKTTCTEQGTDVSNHVIVSDVRAPTGKPSKGMMILIEACLRGAVGDVVVAHRDRLDRATYSMLHFMVHKAGGRLVSLDAEAYRATDAELAEDMFVALQKYKNRSSSSSASQKTYSDNHHHDAEGQGVESNTVVAPKKRRGRPPRVPPVIEETL